VATHRCVPRRTAVIPRSRPPRGPECSTVPRRTQPGSGRSTRPYMQVRPPRRLSLNTMRTSSRTRVPPPSPTSRGPRPRLDLHRSIRRGPRPGTGVWLAPRTRRGPRRFTGPRLAPHTRVGRRRNTRRRLRVRPGLRCATSHRLCTRPGLRCVISRPRPTTSLRRPLRVQVGRRMHRRGPSTAAMPITGPSATGTASAPSPFRQPVERTGPSRLSR
jgi:hypothetical protein